MSRISNEGRILLSLILALSVITLAGIGFLIKGQETQGQMLNDAAQMSEQLQTSIDELQSEDVLLGEFETTFYCAGFGQGCAICGTTGITATGTICSPLGNALVTVAVDPRVIPYGTKLKIIMGDNIVYGIAEDTGGFADGLYPQKKIDICTWSHEEAVSLGVWECEVYIMEGI